MNWFTKLFSKEQNKTPPKIKPTITADLSNYLPACSEPSDTNITRFGAFIDIGVKQDGLVHVSEISHQFISEPGEMLKLNQQVNVKVLEVDPVRKRISLSIKQLLAAPAKKQYNGNATVPKQQSKPMADMPIGDALAALKNKFKK